MLELQGGDAQDFRVSGGAVLVAFDGGKLVKGIGFNAALSAHLDEGPDGAVGADDDRFGLRPSGRGGRKDQ